MNLLLALWAGHIVGDFALQTGRIAEMKRVGWTGLLIHVTMVTLATLVFVIDHPQGLLLVTIVAVIHLGIDAVRTFVVRFLRRSNLAYFFADQAAHFLVLWGLSFGLEPQTFGDPTRWFAVRTFLDLGALYTIAIVLLVFTVPVVEAILYVDWTGGKAAVRISARDRWLGAVERLAGLTLMLSPWPYFMPLVFLPHAIYRLVNIKRQHPALLVRPLISFSFTLLVGWWLRANGPF